jgi:hypothetical protein
LGETHLREVLREYVAHCHAERNHQGLANMRIDPPKELLGRFPAERDTPNTGAGHETRT